MELPDKTTCGDYGQFVANLQGEERYLTLEEVFTYIMGVHDQNRHHVTKGYGLGELDDLGILKYAGGELLELAEATGNAGLDAHDMTREERIQEELGDTMSCLIHLAVKHDIRPDELAKTIINKMEKRFA